MFCLYWGKIAANSDFSTIMCLLAQNGHKELIPNALKCLFRPGLTLNMYFASFKYTSATFVASVVNTIPSITFVIAIVLR